MVMAGECGVWCVVCVCVCVCVCVRVRGCVCVCGGRGELRQQYIQPVIQAC